MAEKVPTYKEGFLCTDDSLRYVYDRKRLKAKKRFLYSCAKHSILPQKTETSEKRVRSFQSQNSIAQRYKNLFFAFKRFLLIGFERIIYIECFILFLSAIPKFLLLHYCLISGFHYLFWFKLKTTTHFG